MGNVSGIFGSVLSAHFPAFGIRHLVNVASDELLQLICNLGSWPCPQCFSLWLVKNRYHWYLVNTTCVYHLRMRRLSVANKSAGSISSSRSDASSETVLYALMTLKATVFWCRTRLTVLGGIHSCICPNGGHI